MTIARPFVKFLVSLQAFFFKRPRIDVDMILNPEQMYGQRSRGLSERNNTSQPTYIGHAIYDMEYHWHYFLRMRNNSKNTAYDIRIEKIHKGNNDYLQRLDNIISLRESEDVQLNYIIRYEQAATGAESERILKPFPGFIDKIEIIISYRNEGRMMLFYTRFIITPTGKTNEHLFRKPKNV